jgi:tetratricopeptide (TPR) repeat protein
MRRHPFTALWLLAAGCASSAPEADPPNLDAAEAAFTAGELAAGKKQHAEATEHYSQAIALAPRFPRPYLSRARSFEALGRHAEAEADYAKAIEVAPEDKKSIYFYHRGRHLQRRGAHSRAVEDFTQAARLQEKWMEPEYYLATYMHRGLALLDLRRNEEALRDFDLVLRKNPDPTTRQEAETLKMKALREKRGP